MNWERILLITNYFLVSTGSQLHIFESITGRFQLSLWALVNFIALTLFYVICVNQHFTQSPLLKIFHDVSPFFWMLLRFHVLLGLIIYIFRLFSMPGIGRSCNAISTIATRRFVRKFTMEEGFAYFLCFSTFIIFLCFALYIAYEMDFKIPPWDNIFIFFGLFIPHFALAGALKLCTINCWLMHEELRQLRTELKGVLIEHFPIENSTFDNKFEVTDSVIGATNTRVIITEVDVQKLLEQHRKRFVQLTDEVKLVSASLQKELILLLVVNSSCLLAGVYTLVYFKTSWHIFFSPSWKRIFYADNIAIYVLIFWDYLCLCTSVSLFNKVKSQTLEEIQVTLNSERSIEKSSYTALNEIRYMLSFELRLRLFNIADINASNLFMVHIILGIIIAIIVIYHYLYDHILATVAQLEYAVEDN